MAHACALKGVATEKPVCGHRATDVLAASARCMRRVSVLMGDTLVRLEYEEQYAVSALLKSDIFTLQLVSACTGCAATLVGSAAAAAPAAIATDCSELTSSPCPHFDEAALAAALFLP